MLLFQDYLVNRKIEIEYNRKSVKRTFNHHFWSI